VPAAAVARGFAVAATLRLGQPASCPPASPHTALLLACYCLLLLAQAVLCSPAALAVQGHQVPPRQGPLPEAAAGGAARDRRAVRICQGGKHGGNCVGSMAACRRIGLRQLSCTEVSTQNTVGLPGRTQTGVHCRLPKVLTCVNCFNCRAALLPCRPSAWPSPPCSCPCAQAPAHPAGGC
jgi:hypothetical protein